mmetsp:Transcript_28193/g.56430  ORF Transcript_28193/g.56430 Transcript_28193/m.56430 type:complete len:81 (-) Transcript_28193:264-506(-)
MYLRGETSHSLPSLKQTQPQHERSVAVQDEWGYLKTESIPLFFHDIVGQTKENSALNLQKFLENHKERGGVGLSYVLNHP